MMMMFNAAAIVAWRFSVTTTGRRINQRKRCVLYPPISSRHRAGGLSENTTSAHAQQLLGIGHFSEPATFVHVWVQLIVIIYRYRRPKRASAFCAAKVTRCYAWLGSAHHLLRFFSSCRTAPSRFSVTVAMRISTDVRGMLSDHLLPG